MYTNHKSHVMCTPRHHGIAYPHLVDGGDGQHRWRAAAKFLNKQSWKLDMKQSSNSSDGRRPTAHHHKERVLQKFHTGYRNCTAPLADKKNGKLTYLNMGYFCFYPNLYLLHTFPFYYKKLAPV